MQFPQNKFYDCLKRLILQWLSVNVCNTNKTHYNASKRHRITALNKYSYNSLAAAIAT